MLRIASFVGGPFSQNCYLATCESSGETVIIDPGAVTQDLLSVVKAEALQVSAILLTHAHLDHIEGLPEVRAAIPAPIYLHSADAPLFERAVDQAAAFGMDLPDLPEPDHDLAHESRLSFGECVFEVRHAPGHAPGHVIFYSAEDRIAFVGDVIFNGSIGRTDLPGGDFQQLISSIRTQVFSLPGETRLLTGHGPETTVEWEMRTNPFLAEHRGGGTA